MKKIVSVTVGLLLICALNVAQAEQTTISCDKLIVHKTINGDDWQKTLKGETPHRVKIFLGFGHFEYGKWEFSKLAMEFSNKRLICNAIVDDSDT